MSSRRSRRDRETGRVWGSGAVICNDGWGDETPVTNAGLPSRWRHRCECPYRWRTALEIAFAMIH